MAISIKKETNGLYTVRVWATSRNEFGKRKSKQKKNLRTYAAAESIGYKYQEELDSFNNGYNENMSFEDLSNLYLANKINLSVTTKENYKTLVPSILKYLGKVKIKDISTRVIQSYINATSNEINPKTKKRIKKGTIERKINYIKAVINWAVGQDILEYNKIKRLEYPEDEEEFEPTILSPQQIGEVLKYLKANFYNIYIPVLLDACLGTRRGEALGLKWDMIDFENNLIYLKKNLVQVDNNVILKNRLKTQKSKRVQGMSPFLKQELLQHKEMNKGLNSDFVCTNIFSGQVPQPRYVTRMFHSVMLTEFNINMRLHDLRHCFNHFANENNVDMYTMINMLGHTNIKTNLYYAGYSTNKIKEAVNIISQNIEKGFKV